MKRPVLAFAWLSSLLLLSLSQLVGCADDGGNGTGLTFNACAPLAIGVAPALTSPQAQGLTDALSMWNQAADTALVSTSMPDPDLPDAGVAATITTPPRVPLVFQAAAPAFHGLYDDGAGRIFINVDLTVDALPVVIAHEIGHAFGLIHVSRDVRPSLMNPGNTTVGITPDDVRALAAIWGSCSTPATSP